VFSAVAKCAWLASAVAALICVVAGTAVQGQTGPSVADDRAAVVESICRQYAAALSLLSANLTVPSLHQFRGAGAVEVRFSVV
jgi:hypothetical protein